MTAKETPRTYDTAFRPNHHNATAAEGPGPETDTPAPDPADGEPGLE